VLSIVLHSSTDVIVARGFAPELMPAWQQRLTRRGRRLLHRSRTIRRRRARARPGTVAPPTARNDTDESA